MIIYYLVQDATAHYCSRQEWMKGTFLVACRERKILCQRESRKVVCKSVCYLIWGKKIFVYISDIYLC